MDHGEQDQAGAGYIDLQTHRRRRGKGSPWGTLGDPDMGKVTAGTCGVQERG